MKLLLAISIIVMISIFAILLSLIFYGLANFYVKAYDRYKQMDNDFILVCKSLINDVFRLTLAIIVMVMITGFICVLIECLITKTTCS